MGPPSEQPRRERKSDKKEARQSSQDTWDEDKPSPEGVLTTTSTSSLTTDSFVSASSILHSIETRFATLQAAQEHQAVVQHQHNILQEERAAVQSQQNAQFQAMLAAQHESAMETRNQFVTFMTALSQRTGVSDTSNTSPSPTL